MVNKLGFSLCLVTNRSQVAGSLEGAVEACLEAGLKGVLEVRIPKPDQRKPRKISIGVGEAPKTIDAQTSATD